MSNFRIAPLSNESFSSQVPSKEVFQSEFEFASLAHLACKTRETKGFESRMENYYNCVDDYSWGGISDRANSQATMKASYNVSLAKEQLESGPIRMEERVSVLADLDGNPVDAKLVNTRYGKSWVIQNNGQPIWVGAEATPATYAKKGYTLLEAVHEYDTFYSFRKNTQYVTLVGSSYQPAKLREGSRKYYPNTRLNIAAYALLNERVGETITFEEEYA